MAPKRRLTAKIGELLLEKQVITKQQLEEALSLQHSRYKGKFLGQILSELGYCREEEIYSTLAMQLGYPYIKLSNCAIDEEVLALVPQGTSERLNFIPIDKIGNILTIAMLNPLEEEPLKSTEEALGLKIKIFVTTPSELKKAQREHYGTARI